MSKLKVITSAQMGAVLEGIGFSVIRQKGSHRFMRHPDGRTTVIPMHVGDLDRALIRKIIRDVELSIDDYNEIV